MAEFKLAIRVLALNDNARKFYPVWFEQYVRFHRFHTKELIGPIPVTQDLLIAFLRHLRDRQVPGFGAWLQRCVGSVFYSLVDATQSDE